LSYLHLGLFSDGRDYSAIGQGLAVSGACPELLEVFLDGVKRNLDWVAKEPSLIIPAVRSLSFGYGCGTEEEWLLLCCGLVQTGYKYLRLHLRDLDNHDIAKLSLKTCMRAILCIGGIFAIF
jgi:hypothetical protein